MSLVLIIVSWITRDISMLFSWCFFYVFMFSFIFYVLRAQPISPKTQMSKPKCLSPILSKAQLSWTHATAKAHLHAKPHLHNPWPLPSAGCLEPFPSEPLLAPPYVPICTSLLQASLPHVPSLFFHAHTYPLCTVPLDSSSPLQIIKAWPKALFLATIYCLASML